MGHFATTSLQVAEGLFAIERLKLFDDQTIQDIMDEVAEGLFAIERLKLGKDDVANEHHAS